MDERTATQQRIDEMTAAYEAKMRTTARQKLEAQITAAIQALMALQETDHNSGRATKIAALVETVRLIRQDVDSLDAIVY